MATTIVPVAYTESPLWECKQCRKLITANETVAYHLVDYVLYGWCMQCFDGRRKDDLRRKDRAESGSARYAGGDVGAGSDR